MKVTIRTTKPCPDGLISNERPRKPYETVSCGDYPYVRFLHGMGVPWHLALRYARDIQIDLPRGKPVVSVIPFLGNWVPFEIPQSQLNSDVWQIEHGKIHIGLEWTINSKPVGMEVYSPADWSEFNEGISNLYVGGYGWLSQEAYLPGRIRDFGNLASLALANCPRLTCLGNLANSSKLRHLFLSAERLPDLDILPLLPIETLFIMDMGKLTSLDVLRKMPGVKTLVVRNCRKLTDLSGLGGHPSIRHLLLEGLPARDLGPVGSIPGLESLQLAGLQKARTLPDRGDHPPPRSLTIRDCPMMVEPPPDNGLLGARSLRFEKIRNWSWETVLAGRAPKSLALSGCGLDDESLRRLPTIGRITSLDLSDNQGITTIRSLKAAKRLRTLMLDNCRGLRTIAGLGAISRIETLSLTLCSNIRSIQPLSRCTRLRSLSLAGLQRAAQQSAWLTGLHGIRELSVAGWDRVADFGFLAKMAEAYYVDLRGRIFQENSPFAARMPRLCYLLNNFFADLEQLYRLSENELPQDLRQSSVNQGIPGSDRYTPGRQGWWDIPRESLWNPGLFTHEGHGTELLERITADMNGLIQAPPMKSKLDFLSSRSRPGTLLDLDRRRTEPTVQGTGTPLEAVRQLQALSWANNPFDAGNGHTRLAWQLALEYQGHWHGPAAHAKNPGRGHRFWGQILRELFQALEGMSAAKPGGGPKPPRVKAIVLKDPDRPNARVEASQVRAGRNALRVIKSTMRQIQHTQRMKARFKPRATYVTPSI